MHKYIGLALIFPLIGFIVNGLFGWKIRKEKIIGWFGSLTVGASFVVSLLVYIELLGLPSYERKFIVEYFSWIKTGAFEVSFSYLVDPLSVLMAMVVTGVGFLIHVYSIGYMHGDRGFARFFAYLNLFIFMMLTLVLADNYLLMFLGWEGVGLCSYLLIGFWYDRPFEKMTTSDAGRKAFIVNRIGDFGFLIGLFLMYRYFGSLNFNTVFSIADKLSVGDTTVFWITLLLFIGATGKSAQIPLYVWLPDAMAGPTPVSALIHAATMVTAGVYMIARSSVLYALAPTTMTIVAIIGALTAVYSASIGLVQNGIKKVLAYSTISQLGYMFLAMGVGAFSAGIFHLTTHAFFKALLFLGAGAVMHALDNEEDIQKMGGLKEHLPITYKTFFIASLAIAGIPPLSGFFSKDEILWGAYSQGSFLLWLLGAVGAFMTAFYMFRLVALVFETPPRYGAKHPHEAPKVMTIPLMILAFFSVISGFVGVPESFGVKNLIHHWLEPVFEDANAKLVFEYVHSSGEELLLMTLSILIGVAGILLARYLYLKRMDLVRRLTQSFSWIYKLVYNKYYVDEIYDTIVVKPVTWGSEKLLWRFFDVKIIDGIVNGSAKVTYVVSSILRFIQNGIVQFYAVIFIIGVLLIILFLI
jgi:NADH-quinone oxidoreductase subunit L